MKQELDDKLCTTFPKIFKDRHGDMRATCMVWGFECGNGWFDLIYDLCDKIQRYIDANPDVPQVIAVQVKEKFGGLRFYFDGGDYYIERLVDDAERESYKTCENCGSKENIGQTSGWISTVCKVCYDTRGENDNRQWKENKHE